MVGELGCVRLTNQAIMLAESLVCTSVGGVSSRTSATPSPRAVVKRVASCALSSINSERLVASLRTTSWASSVGLAWFDAG